MSSSKGRLQMDFSIFKPCSQFNRERWKYDLDYERYKSVIFIEFNDMEKTEICFMNSFAMNLKW